MAYVSAGREDIRILAIDREDWNRALAFAHDRGRPGFLMVGPPVNPKTLQDPRARTPPAAAQAGLVQATFPPPKAGPGG
jgi:hypothetical protein